MKRKRIKRDTPAWELEGLRQEIASLRHSVNALAALMEDGKSGIRDNLRLASENYERNTNSIVRAASEMVSTYNRLVALVKPKKRWWQ